MGCVLNSPLNLHFRDIFLWQREEEILTDFFDVSKPTGSHDIKPWAEREEVVSMKKNKVKQTSDVPHHAAVETTIPRYEIVVREC